MNSTTQFLPGGGEMGELTRNKDWSKTPVGSPDTWPQSLRTTLSIILNSKFPMFLWWGPELTCFYNDAYRPSLGQNGKHPSILGQKAKDAWPEIWPIIKPLIDQVLAGGEATWSEDQLIPIYRNGKLENVYWTFSYSPVIDESGKVAGVLVTCSETTEKVNTLKNIEERENQLNFILNAAELGTWSLNPQTNKFTGNSRLKEWFGLEEESEIDLLDVLNVISEKDRQRVSDAMQNALKPGSDGNYNIEYSISNFKNKKERIVVAKGKTLFNNDGIAFRFSGTLQDITSQSTAKKNLEEREQKFRLLADSMPQFVWTGDPNGNLNYSNKSLYDYSGLTPQQIETNGWLQIVHPDERDENVKKWIHSVTSGEEFIFEHRFKRHDGEYHWQLSRAIPQKDDSGMIKMWVGTSTDIQEQKLFATELEKQVKERTKELKDLNEKLSKSEERYHLMIEEIQDYAIIYLNVNGNIEKWNKGAEKIKGYHAEEIIGKNFSVFYTAPDLRNNLPNKLLAHAREHGRAIQEGWRVRKDGSFFWASIVITAIHDAKNNVIGFAKVTHDLTEKKQTSDQLEQKNKELERMNTELQSFAYVSSHDLQEPLRKIQTFAARVLEKEYQNLSENGKDYFNRMQKAASRMQTLIEDLLNYSRTNTTDNAFELTDLKEIINEVKNEFKELVNEKNAVIEIEAMEKATIIPFQFRQIIHNLIGNSLKFSKPGTPPHIIFKSEIKTGSEFNVPSLPARKTYFHLSVSDNGIGFENQYKDRIFEVFQRLHGKNEYKGTGIGLAIVKKIVENHHGIIVANGTINGGAQFDIYIPG